MRNSDGEVEECVFFLPAGARASVFDN